MLHRSSLTVAATLAFAAAASSQVSLLYNFSQATGVYTPITGGTLIAAVTGTTAVLSLDDNTYPVTLPFTFNYEGVPQTQVMVQTNGHIAFGAVSPTSYTPLSSTTVAPGFIAACGRDLQGGYVCASTRTLGSDQVTAISANGPLAVGDVLVGTGIPVGTTILAIAGNTLTMSALATANSAGTAMTAYGPWSEMRWELQGTTPNQVFIVQWSNFRRFGTGLTTTQDTNLNFQIRLNEGGTIECAYGNCAPGATTTTALHQVGLRGPTNAFPLNINNRLNVKGTSDWATSTAGTLNSSGQVFNNVAPANVIPNGLTYTWTPAVGTIATNTTLGVGCGSNFASFYQNFATSAAFNLGGTALSTVGSPYTVIPGLGTLNPVGGSPTTLVLTDDSEATYTFVNGFTAPGWGAGVTVCSNGFISKATGNGTSFSLTVATFLAGPQDWFALGWHDMNPAIVGSGQVKVEETATLLTITYDGVWDYLGTSAANANTMQMQVTSAGDVTYAYGTMSVLGNGRLVGYSPGGANLDPGSRTLLASVPFSLGSGPDVPALALAALNRPKQLVAGPNNWDLNATNLPAGLGLDIIGLSDAGITDLSLFGLGLPGCQLRATLDIIQGPFVAGGAHPWSFTIPPGAPALSGVELFVQNAVLDFTVNLALTKTSNGIKGKIGDL